MSGSRERKREDLKTRLIDAARGQLAEHGLRGLRARDITAAAGCALGGLYNAFEDLDDLILHVNSATLNTLDGILLEATSQSAGDPESRLRALAHAYLRFALENRNLWMALFEHRLPDGRTVPQWHLEEHTVMFRHVVEPLAVLEPGLSEEELVVHARTAFSAVHGIVVISLGARFIGLPKDRLEAELDRFTRLLAAGTAASAGRS